MKRWRIGLVAVVMMGALTGAHARPRYFINTIWLSSALRHGTSLESIKRTIDVSKSRGCNAMSVCIAWDTERPDGSYDFSAYEPVLRYIVDQGMALQIRVNTALNFGIRLDWVTDEMVSCTRDGAVYQRKHGEWLPVLTHPVVREKMRNLYRALGAWTRERHIPVIAFSAAWTLYMESEYFCVGLDYSAASQKAFLAWVEERVAGVPLKRLNERWGTNLTSRDEITLLSVPQPLRELFFSHVLDVVFVEQSKALKEGDPTAQYGVQFGCFWDNPGRHNMLTNMRAKEIDWIFVADAPSFDFSFSCDALRACWRGKRIANEIDGPSRFVSAKKGSPSDLARKQGLDSFNAGVDAVLTCNWNAKTYGDRGTWSFHEAVSAMAADPVPEIAPKRAIYMSTWDLVSGTGKAQVYRQAYRKLRGERDEPIDILNDVALIADADRLDQYDTIILPHNRTMTKDVRAVLSRISAKRLDLWQPAQAGTLTPFGRVTEAFSPPDR